MRVVICEMVLWCACVIDESGADGLVAVSGVSLTGVATIERGLDQAL